MDLLNFKTKIFNKIKILIKNPAMRGFLLVF